ncbi:MAG: MFS transporter [Treponema sp.]|nr:MAG: MFS transporter [Treponema sp.]
METKSDDKKMSALKKFGFGFADIGGNLFFTAMGFWALAYLTDTVMLSASLAGIVVMVAKVWDAVTDPIVGYLSDKTYTRWGRRRPYILFGAVPFGFFVWLFFTNPNFTDQNLLFIYMLILLCLVNTAMTVVNIPYSSLTPELTEDYDERSSLNTYRFVLAGFGTIIGAVVVSAIKNNFADDSLGFSVSGAVMGAIITISSLVTFFSVREKKLRKNVLPKEKQKGFKETYAFVFKNKAFMILLIAFTCHLMIATFLQGIMIYYLKYIHNESDTTMIMSVFLIVIILSVPLSTLISKKIGKRAVYQIGFAEAAILCVIIFFVGHRTSLTVLTYLMGVLGIGIGFMYATPWSMIPDTIEWDVLKTGVRSEGSYYGIWTFMSKFGQAIAIGITGVILDIAGYVPDTVQSNNVILAIRSIAGIIPAVIAIITIILLFKYPITKEVYNKIISEIAQKDSEKNNL